jgi:hypothetical protein
MPDAPAGTPELNAQVESIMGKIFGSSNWRNETERTVRRNVKLMAKNKELLAENETLKGGGLKEGERKLTKEEGVIFDAFKALNLKPEEIKAVVEEHKKLKVKEQEGAEEAQYKLAAESLDYANEAALTRWLKREGLHLEFKDEVTRGEGGVRVTKKVPVVRPKDDDKAALESLEAYLEREVPDFIDTFKTAPIEEEGEEGEAGGEEGDEELVARAATETRRRVGGGVRVPATRSSSTASPATRDRKVAAQLEQTAADDPMYSI